jgi:hypothetical protein
VSADACSPIAPLALTSTHSPEKSGCFGSCQPPFKARASANTGIAGTIVPLAIEVLDTGAGKVADTLPSSFSNCLFGFRTPNWDLRLHRGESALDFISRIEEALCSRYS